MYAKKMMWMLLFTAMAAAAGAQVTTGADKDAHGCKASAGYTWSVLRNDCIRLFEQDVQLLPLHNKKSYTAQATVVFSKDGRQAEVFVPGAAAGAVLKQAAKKGTWAGSSMVLAKAGNVYQLRKGKVLMYQSKQTKK